MSYPDEWNHVFQDAEADLAATRKDRTESEDFSHRAYSQALEDIMDLTDHDAPGIYEPDMVELVNRRARIALGIRTAPLYSWAHNTPPNVMSHNDFPTSDVESGLIGQVLEKLSGDLNYDNVAQAKEMLKSLLD